MLSEIKAWHRDGMGRLYWHVYSWNGDIEPGIREAIRAVAYRTGYVGLVVLQGGKT